MKWIRFFLPVMLAFLCVSLGGHVMSVQAKPKVEKMSVGKTYPEMHFGALPSTDAGEYLGVTAAETVVLQQIPARLVIIDILNVLCPDCHKNVPKVNQLYTIIENDADLKSDIRIIAIAAGNEEKQIKMFVDQYGIRFPVFADPADEIYARLGSIGPPGLIITDNAGKVHYIHEGVIKDLDGLLETIRDIHRQ